jgi:hypothetical protein
MEQRNPRTLIPEGGVFEAGVALETRINDS